MTFVTPLLYHEEAEKVEKHLNELKEGGTIRHLTKCTAHQDRVWFTGMYKDMWDAPPNIDIMDDVIKEMAWCSDEHAGGWIGEIGLW